MGKRRTTIVVSSDDDEGENDFVLNSNSSYCKLKVPPQSSSTPPLRTNPKRAKKAARVSNSGSRSRCDSNPFDEIKLFCEGFDDGFTGFKVFAGDEKSKKKELWVDKYKPLSLEELAVHKKKVEEVTTWFEDRLRRSEEDRCNHVLLITGQAGVGKSATVHVIASQLGAQVCEWNTPTPTIWQEHAHNSGSGIRYTSKLDEFENFVERIRKYGLISSSNTDGSQKSTVLLIDDLPVINGKAAYRRLQSSLHLLVRSIHIPTALIITDYGQADSSDYTMRCWDALQSAGTCKVAFNPITVNSIKKTLSRICRDEHCSVTAEHIDLIAKASGGDIRHAITSLQYFCLKLNPMLSLSISNGTPAYQQESSALNYGVSLPFGRDETLSLFHALGKFLHNKRESQDSITSVDKDAVCLRERFRRLPLKMEAPEKVLCQAHGQARTTTDFLHENVLDFLSEEAIEDAWAVSSYLSDADSLLASFSGLLIRNSETENVVQSAAASVAARGVLFGNSQPLSSRWHSVRRPKIWEVEQSLWRNKSAMVRQRSAVYNGMNLSHLPVIATEFRPVLKWLGYRASQNLEDACHIKMNTDMVEDDDSCDCTRMDGQNNETGSDDEIEDW